MGWGSATVIFDNVCGGLLADKPQTQEETIIAQRLGMARPIFVALGDVVVDWNAPQSEGYRAMFDTPNDNVTGLAPAKEVNHE